MAGAHSTVRGKRKTKVGRVVSDKMDKTIVVSVERLARHPLYKRVIRLTTKFKAHDELNDGARRRHRPHRGVAAALGDEALAARRGRLARWRGSAVRAIVVDEAADDRGDPRRGASGQGARRRPREEAEA